MKFTLLAAIFAVAFCHTIAAPAPLFSEIYDHATDALENVISGEIGKVMDLVGLVKDEAADAMELVQNFSFENLAEYAIGHIEKIDEVFDSEVEKFLNLENLISDNLIKGLQFAADGGVEAVIDNAQEIWSSVSDNLEDVKDSVMDFASTAKDVLLEDKENLENVAAELYHQAENVVSDAQAIGKTIVNGAKAAIQAAVETVSS